MIIIYTTLIDRQLEKVQYDTLRYDLLTEMR